LHAWRKAHSLIGPINPVSSAIGMNLAGEMKPWTGWFQRRSASNPVIFSVVVCTTG
jgi:hypothetical protein